MLKSLKKVPEAEDPESLKNHYPLLETIEYPGDLRKLEVRQLPGVCQELREYLIDTLSNVGGHFASNLGVVELTVALHYVYNTPVDRLIWDVGHQTYPHKILTGRRNLLRSVRRMGGLSGFPKREESIYDTYNTGHAGTSVSQLIGEALARDVLGRDYECAAVIGDASAASGMVFEALNHGGELQTDCTVILNDNDMSISKNVGALNQYLNRLITSPIYNKWRRIGLSLLMWIPVIGPAVQMFARRLERTFKDFLIPGSLFQDFGFRYIGPVDGHNVIELVRVLRQTMKMKGPRVLHVYTQKGKGYQPAEENPIRFHGVPTFNRADGTFKESGTQKDKISYSRIVGETLLEMAEKNDRIMAITPAMIEGSGLRPLYDRLPHRVLDVGIAEQHCLTFAGSLASGGLIPFVCIYSTFLNRALDQLIQDVALMNLPVRLVIDRAGCVGPDGETHQGLYDIGMLLAVPNVRVYAPATGGELKAMLRGMEHDDAGPLAVRFPKAKCDRDILIEESLPDVSSTRPVLSGSGKDLAIICVGVMWETGQAVEKYIRNSDGILSTVVGVRWIRPLDFEYLERILLECDHFIIIEDSYIHSGAASYIRSNLSAESGARHLKTFAFPEQAILHGGRDEILHRHGMSPQAIANYILTHDDYEKKSFTVVAASTDL